jgi:hypothetical protein
MDAVDRAMALLQTAEESAVLATRSLVAAAADEEATQAAAAQAAEAAALKDAGVASAAEDAPKAAEAAATDAVAMARAALHSAEVSAVERISTLQEPPLAVGPAGDRPVDSAGVADSSIPTNSDERRSPKVAIPTKPAYTSPYPTAHSTPETVAGVPSDTGGDTDEGEDVFSHPDVFDGTQEVLVHQSSTMRRGSLVQMQKAGSLRF